MSAPDDGFAVMRHDWHSQSYVEEWIARDLLRDEERRTRLRKMLSVAAFSPDTAISVLDVGGGYGMVTEEVLRAFPHARVTGSVRSVSGLATPPGSISAAYSSGLA